MMNAFEKECFIGQHDRTDELNERIQSRHFPDVNLKPNLGFRSVPSKYVSQPQRSELQRLSPPSISKFITEDSLLDKLYLDFHTEISFFPGNNKAPFSGYKIDVDNDLSNRMIKLHKGDLGTKYIPNTKSNLFQPMREPENMAVMGSITKETMLPPIVGSQMFQNHTRSQLRGIGYNN